MSPVGSLLVGAVALFLAMGPFEQADGIVVQMPIQRHEGVRMRYLRQGRSAEFKKLREKHEARLAKTHGEHARSKRGVFTSRQNDYWDAFWLGAVTIGTPPQQFTMHYDTGSSDTWILDSGCTACVGKTVYQRTASLSYVPDGRAFSIVYGIGYAKGVEGTDVFEIIDAGGNNLIMNGSTIGLANDVDTQSIAMPTEGLLGLGFQALSVNKVLPPITAAINDGQLDAPLFTAFLKTDGGTAGNVTNGLFTFGGIDTTNCGAVMGYASLTAQTYWQFSVDKINANGKPVQKKPVQAISDTGTSYIIGPKKKIKKIARKVKAKYDKSSDSFMIKCAKTYKVVFIIGGIKYKLTEAVLTIDTGRGDGWCSFAMSVSTDSLWILGDSFIRAYCQIYDVGNKRVGFAPVLSSG